MSALKKKGKKWKKRKMVTVSEQNHVTFLFSYELFEIDPIWQKSSIFSYVFKLHCMSIERNIHHNKNMNSGPY